jgi:hypothetical protein
LETGEQRGVVQESPSSKSCGATAGSLFFWKIREARTLVVGDRDERPV